MPHCSDHSDVLLHESVLRAVQDPGKLLSNYQRRRLGIKAVPGLSDVDTHLTVSAKQAVIQLILHRRRARLPLQSPVVNRK